MGVHLPNRINSVAHSLPGQKCWPAGLNFGLSIVYLFLYKQSHGNECILTECADQNWDFLELWGKERISGARLKHKLGINSRNKQTIERSVGSTGNAFCQGQIYHPKNRE